MRVLLVCDQNMKNQKIICESKPKSPSPRCARPHEPTEGITAPCENMSENLCENLLENLREKGGKKRLWLNKVMVHFFTQFSRPEFLEILIRKRKKKTPLQTNCKLPLGQCFFSYVFRAPGGGTKGE